MARIIAGWVLSGIGVANLAIVPLCYHGYSDLGGFGINQDSSRETGLHQTENSCAVVSGAIGVVGVAIGAPLLISGYGRHSRWKAWERRNGGTQVLLDTRIMVREDSAFVSYSTSF